MTKTRLLRAAAFASAVGGAAVPGRAVSDLLVAPTRIVLNGARGTEVVLNNIGDKTATCRISLDLKRMTLSGGLVDQSPVRARRQLRPDQLPRRAPH